MGLLFLVVKLWKSPSFPRGLPFTIFEYIRWEIKCHLLKMRYDPLSAYKKHNAVPKSVRADLHDIMNWVLIWDKQGRDGNNEKGFASLELDKWWLETENLWNWWGLASDLEVRVLVGIPPSHTGGGLGCHTCLCSYTLFWLFQSLKAVIMAWVATFLLPLSESWAELATSCLSEPCPDYWGHLKGGPEHGSSLSPCLSEEMGAVWVYSLWIIRHKCLLRVSSLPLSLSHRLSLFLPLPLSSTNFPSIYHLSCVSVYVCAYVYIRCASGVFSDYFVTILI